MRCWRLTKTIHAELDGEGALLFGGRWNPPGLRTTYASDSRALAALEYLGHLDLAHTRAPLSLVMLEIEVPDGVLRPIGIGGLPPDWRDPLRVTQCRELGRQWAEEGLAGVTVPSALIPEESNVVLFHGHPDLAPLRVTCVDPFYFDPRLLEQG